MRNPWLRLWVSGRGLGGCAGERGRIGLGENGRRGCCFVCTRDFGDIVAWLALERILRETVRKDCHNVKSRRQRSRYAAKSVRR